MRVYTYTNITCGRIVKGDNRRAVKRDLADETKRFCYVHIGRIILVQPSQSP